VISEKAFDDASRIGEGSVATSGGSQNQRIKFIDTPTRAKSLLDEVNSIKLNAVLKPKEQVMRKAKKNMTVYELDELEKKKRERPSTSNNRSANAASASASKVFEGARRSGQPQLDGPSTLSTASKKKKKRKNVVNKSTLDGGASQHLPQEADITPSFFFPSLMMEMPPVFNPPNFY